MQQSPRYTYQAHVERYVVTAPLYSRVCMLAGSSNTCCVKGAADKDCVLHASVKCTYRRNGPDYANLQTLAGKASAPLLPQLAQSLPDWFEGTRHSSFLYVASELIKVFGSDVSQRQQLGGHPVAPHPAGGYMLVSVVQCRSFLYAFTCLLMQ